MIRAPAGGGGRAMIAHEDALNFPGGRMTVEAYVYTRYLPSGSEHTPRIVSKYDHGEQDVHRGWEWIINSNGTLQFRVQQAPPAREVALDSTSRLALEKWTHLATVYDRTQGEVRIYIDGKLDASKKADLGPLRINREQDLFVGRYGGGDIAVFDGMIDELRLTARALTFTERPSKPSTGGEPDTIALYHFDRVADGAAFEDASAAPRHPAVLLIAGDGALAESLPGFGRALNVSAE